MNRRTFDSTFRARIEDAIDNLLAMLDEIDGDEDLEPNLGFSLWPGDDECEEDGTEHEPSLGAPEGLMPAASLHWDGHDWVEAKGVRRFRLGSQKHWAQGDVSIFSVDAEDEFDGREPDADRETEHEGGDSDMGVII